MGRRHFVSVQTMGEQRMTVYLSTFLFFKKASSTCLMVTDIFGSWKKTEVYRENFPRWENTLKYLISSLPTCSHCQCLRRQRLIHSVLSSNRPEKPQHPSGAYCITASQVFLGNFWRIEYFAVLIWPMFSSFPLADIWSHRHLLHTVQWPRSKKQVDMVSMS